MVARSALLRLCDDDLIPLLLENMGKLGLDVRIDTPFSGVEKLEDGTM